MDINKIKYLPKTNAVADVYTKATGMPFVGEMMVAAAGQESEPTPDPDPEPTPTVFTVSNVRAVECENDPEEPFWTIQADANMDATGYTVYVKGDNGEFEYHLRPDEEDPTKLVGSDEYDNPIEPSLLSDGGHYTGWYRKEGVEEEVGIQGTYTVQSLPKVDCENDWEAEGFESYEDCDCQVNGNCPPDCDNWEDMGYGSYEDCDCAENGNCGEEEPAPFEITDMTVMLGDGGYGTVATTTNDSTDYSINVTIMDANGELIWFTSDMEANSENPMLFYGSDNGDIDPNAAVPSLGDDVGHYTAIISDSNGGEWTVTGIYSYWDE